MRPSFGLGRLPLPQTLVWRVVALTAVTAAIAAAGMAWLALSIASLRQAVDREKHSRDTLIAALSLQETFGTLESSLRGYLLTLNSRLLDPWNKERGQIAPETRQLRELVDADPGQRRRVASLREQMGEYLSDYAEPVKNIARTNPQLGRSQLASAEGQRRSVAINGLLDRIVAIEDARAAERRASVNTASTEALAGAIGGSALAVLGILAGGLLVARSVRRRVRGATAAASQVAGGDFSIRLDEQGPRELAHLATAFNAMARSLDDSRRELLEQNERLEQSERQKSELITLVSHELRTPLTSLLGFTNLLLARSFEPEEQRRYIGIVHQESRRLAALVERFLDLRSIEEGRLELRREDVDLGALVREQSEFLLAHAPLHELALRLPDEDVVVSADRDRLAQVIANLVGNAVKYSPEGGPVEVLVMQGEGDAVRVEVTDHGYGIPKDDQPHVFTKFFRGAASDAGIPGTGLGLAVAREIVEAHGGEIGFVSAPGRGSTFWVELPRGEPAPAAAHRVEEPQAR